MGYLLLAIACSLIVGIIFKVAPGLRIDRFSLLTVNYLAGALCAVARGADVGNLTSSSGFLILGVVTGVLFIAGYALFSVATQMAGLAASIGTMRISVCIPFMASWLIWHETPTTGQTIGFAAALLAFACIASSRNGNSNKTPAGRSGTLALVALFLVAGVSDAAVKVFDEEFSAVFSRPDYLLMAFGVAAMVGFAVLGFRRKLSELLRGRNVLAGILLGTINYGSAEFFLLALDLLPGTFVFPFNHVSIVVGGALLGVAVWREALTPIHWTGLGLAVIALVLLSV